jgi:coatomer protein complex subunit gamma
MVSLEACRAYSQIKSLNNKEISQAISVLLLFLTNEHNSVIKFSALKTLNQLIDSPLRANLLVNVSEIEELINDNNRSIATIAISLLLKISKED